MTSCQYGIDRLGDEWVTPNKVDYLARSISQQLPDSKQLTVTHFVTYLNMQYWLRAGNIFRGPVWELVECDENTDEFVNYTQAENPQRQPIIIGTLKGNIDGVSFSQRMLAFPECPDGGDTCVGWDARAYAVKKVVLGLTHSVIEAHKQQVSLTP